MQAEYVRVPMADSTLIPTPDNVTDKEALLVGDVLPTGALPSALWSHCCGETSSGCCCLSYCVVGCHPLVSVAIVRSHGVSLLPLLWCGEMVICQVVCLD